MCRLFSSCAVCVVLCLVILAAFRLLCDCGCVVVSVAVMVIGVLVYVYLYWELLWFACFLWCLDWFDLLVFVWIVCVCFLGVVCEPGVLCDWFAGFGVLAGYRFVDFEFGAGADWFWVFAM